MRTIHAKLMNGQARLLRELFAAEMRRRFERLNTWRQIAIRARTEAHIDAAYVDKQVRRSQRHIDNLRSVAEKLGIGVEG